MPFFEFLGQFVLRCIHYKNPDVKEYANTLSSANLQQHIDTATHESGNILDHVICSCDENFVQDCKVYENLITVPWTVHHFDHFKVNLQKPLPQRVTKTLRNFKNIESAAFSQTLTDHLNLVHLKLEMLMNFTNGTMKPLPIVLKSMHHQKRLPGQSKTVSHGIMKLSILPGANVIVQERKWRHSQSETDRADFKTARNKVCYKYSWS